MKSVRQVETGLGCDERPSIVTALRSLIPALIFLPPDSSLHLHLTSPFLSLSLSLSEEGAAS